MFLKLGNVAGSFPLIPSPDPNSKIHSSKNAGVFLSFVHSKKNPHLNNFCLKMKKSSIGALVAEKSPVDRLCFVVKSVSLNAKWVIV